MYYLFICFCTYFAIVFSHNHRNNLFFDVHIEKIDSFWYNAEIEDFVWIFFLRSIVFFLIFIRVFIVFVYEVIQRRQHVNQSNLNQYCKFENRTNDFESSFENFEISFYHVAKRKILLSSSLSYKLYFTYNENLITKKRKWAIKFRKSSYKSNATMKLYAILSRKLWKKSSHKLYNSINKKTA